MVPMGAYPTADGYLNVSALRDFRRFCELLDAPELADDPRYVDFASRHAHRAELDADIARRVADPHDRRVGGAAGRARAVRTGARGRRGVRRSAGAAPAADRAACRTRRAATSTCCVRRSPSATRRRRCGRVRQPTARTRREVLAELGYSDDEIDDLHASGAVGTQEHA